MHIYTQNGAPRKAWLWRIATPRFPRARHEEAAPIRAPTKKNAARTNRRAAPAGAPTCPGLPDPQRPRHASTSCQAPMAARAPQRQGPRSAPAASTPKHARMPSGPAPEPPLAQAGPQACPQNAVLREQVRRRRRANAFNAPSHQRMHPNRLLQAQAALARPQDAMLRELRRRHRADHAPANGTNTRTASAEGRPDQPPSEMRWCGSGATGTTNLARTRQARKRRATTRHT